MSMYLLFGVTISTSKCLKKMDLKNALRHQINQSFSYINAQT